MTRQAPPAGTWTRGALRGQGCWWGSSGLLHSLPLGGVSGWQYRSLGTAGGLPSLPGLAEVHICRARGPWLRAFPGGGGVGGVQIPSGKVAEISALVPQGPAALESLLGLPKSFPFSSYPHPSIVQPTFREAIQDGPQPPVARQVVVFEENPPEVGDGCGVLGQQPGQEGVEGLGTALLLLQ